MGDDRPDWRLPFGVDRGLWNYVTDAGVAAGYDAALAGSPLFDQDVAFVRRHCPPGRLLDLGCGTGRLAVPLAAAGYTCVGVDLSAAMLREAVGKAAAAGVRVGLARANLTDLGGLASGAFDAAACLFGTLGMLAGAEARRRALAEARRVLRPGGVLVLHAHNRGHLLTTPAGRAWLLAGGWRSGGDRATRGPGGVGELTMHLFTRGELTAAVRAAGFRVLAVEPVGPAGPLSRPGWLPRWRAVGFLVAATTAR